MNTELLISESFRKLLVNGETIATMYKQTGGLWQIRDRRTPEPIRIVTFDIAVSWLASLTLSIAVVNALS